MAIGKTKSPLEYKFNDDLGAEPKKVHHYYRKHIVCDTDSVGQASPPVSRSPVELAVDATDGFIPLWAPNVVLRWRFQERSMEVFRDPEAAKTYIRDIFGRGIQLWQDAVPVRFKEAAPGDVWDFEIVMMADRKCVGPGRCTLASAFFPDGGRHELKLYPNLFEENETEQVETMAHELGHIFGLRHFFANITETRWHSELFGEHEPFTIMNYGEDSFMTDQDRSDLKELYRLAWSGELKDINGTRLHLVIPFSALNQPHISGNAIAMR